MHFHIPGPDQTHWYPLPSTVYIRDSHIHGLGVFAAKDLNEGDVIGISHIEPKDAELGNLLLRTPLGGYLNYSEERNCYRYNVRRPWGFIWVLRPLRNIEAHEELTLLYANYNPSEPSKSTLDLENLELEWLTKQVRWEEQTAGFVRNS